MAYSVYQHVIGRRCRAGLTLHELELPCPATAHPKISSMSRLNDIVQRLHSLFDLISATVLALSVSPHRRIVIKSVTL
jgi:hypothetical protein